MTALAVLALAGCDNPVSTDATPAVDCADWNSKKYFQAAAVEDVTDCLTSGADIKARDEDGETPLHWAARFNENPAVIAALLDAGADPEARDEAGKTPWDYAKDSESLKDSDVYWRLNEARFR